jgi:hypothetical protein
VVTVNYRLDQPPTLRAVLSKEWPYNGENGRLTEEYETTWRLSRGIQRATASFDHLIGARRIFVNQFEIEAILIVFYG